MFALNRRDGVDQQSPSPALFFDTISAYQRTEALRAAIELDLFTLVGEGQRTAVQLASACNASPVAFVFWRTISLSSASCVNMTGNTNSRPIATFSSVAVHPLTWAAR